MSKNKKPSWLHPIERLEYNGSMKTYKEIQAYILPKDIAESYDVDLPPSFSEQPALYLLRGLGYKKGLPPGTGVGLVQSPYADIYTKIYGVNPIADLSLYRKIYRNHPDIQNAIQMQANLAIGKGFTLKHKDEKVIEYVLEKCNELDIMNHMLTMATDCLVYGNSFTEIQWDKTVSKKEQMYEYNGEHYTRNDLEELEIPLKQVKNATVDDKGTAKNFVAEVTSKDPESKTIVALKDLDPLYMRVRRDSYGNCFGFIQWLAFPPVLIDNESCIHIKNRPMSWGYESMVSTCIVRTNPSIKKIEDLLIGDKVLTASGNYIALEEPPNAHPYEGKMFKIFSKYTNIPLECTYQHPVLTYIENGMFEYKFAKDLKKGDKLVVPVNTSYIDIAEIDLRDYMSYVTLLYAGFTKERDELLWSIYNETKSYTITSQKLRENGHPILAGAISSIVRGKSHPKGKSVKIKFGKSLFRLAGYYLAEGSSTKHRVNFAFGSDELEFAEEVVALGRELFGAKGQIKRVLNTYIVTIKSTPCRILLEYLCGKDSHDKRIATILMKANPVLQQELFETWINGDGNHRKNSKRISGVTVSQELAYQLQQIILRQGKTAGLKKRISYKERKLKDGRIIHSSPIQYIVEVCLGKCSKFVDNKLMLPITKIETYDYKGLVWDIHVPDKETFCTEFGYAVHNSAYGTSILMPIIKNTELLEQFENDASVWIHSRAVPPLIVKGGSPEKPYSTAQMGELMNTLKSRTAATMIFTKGDVAFEELQTIASDLNLDWWINYLLLRRYQALGVPPLLMGKADKGSKGTAEVVLHDFVSRLQVLQEFIADPIEEYIFKPLIKEKFGDSTENVEIIWRPIIEETKDMRSQRLIQLLQAGAISVNECRAEMGFNMISEAKYDKLESKEPATNQNGFPPKKQPEDGAQPAFKKPALEPESKGPEQRSKNPPEGHMKLEDIKTRKVQLLQLEESFREKMLSLTQKTKFELKDGAKLTKDVKQEAVADACRVINENVISSYLIGRLNANAAVGKDDNLSLTQEDLKHVATLKEKCSKDFEKILDDMIASKENGTLE